MSKQPKPELIDEENPEWTAGDFARAISFDKLPPALRTKLGKGRGPQEAPTKERITIRLSPEVVKQFRATGQGWQTRMDAALKDWLNSHSPA